MPRVFIRATVGGICDGRSDSTEKVVGYALPSPHCGQPLRAISRRFAFLMSGRAVSASVVYSGPMIAFTLSESISWRTADDVPGPVPRSSRTMTCTLRPSIVSVPGILLVPRFLATAWYTVLVVASGPEIGRITPILNGALLLVDEESLLLLLSPGDEHAASVPVTRPAATRAAL